MPSRPKTEAEFASLALRMADSGAFFSAQMTFSALCYWRDTACWWSDDLARLVDTRCQLARQRVSR